MIHQNGVAIRRGPRDAGRTDRAARAGYVLDQNILTQFARHRLRDDARDDIERAARREWNHHHEWTGGIVALSDGGGGQCRHGKGELMQDIP